MSWIVTKSGREIEFENLENSDIVLEDLLHATSQINRFTGHTSRPYSVLAHSIGCGYYAQQRNWSDEAQLACMFHDLHEGLIGDISTPVKLMITGVTVFERTVESHVHNVFGLRRIMQSNAGFVKEADIALLLYERNHLIGHPKRLWAMDDRPPTVPIAPLIFGTSGEQIAHFYHMLFSLDESVIPQQTKDFISNVYD